MLYIITAVFVLLALLAFVFFEGDIIHPGFIVPTMFAFSCFCTLYSAKMWGTDIGTKTAGILISSVLAFMIASYLTYYFFNRISATSQGAGKSILQKNNPANRQIMPIRVSNFVLVLFVIFEIVSAVLYLRAEMRVVSSNGGSMSDWTSMMGSYKQMTHFDNIDSSIPGIIAQMYQLTGIIGKVYAYILVHNLVADRKLKKSTVALAIPVLVYGVAILFSGNRLSLLRLAIFCVVVYFVLWHKSVGWRRPVSIKLLLGTVIVMIAVLALFVIVRSAVGRTSTADPLYYISSYAGGSIHLFDLYIKNPVPTQVWGQKTFYYMNSFIGKRTGDRSLVYSFADEFRYSNGINVGNVYTGLRAFYGDFGYAGTIVAMILNGVFFSALYSALRRHMDRKALTSMDLPTMLYAHISYTFFFMSINYYADYVQPNFIKLIIFYIIIIYLVQVKVKFRKSGICLSHPPLKHIRFSFH